MGRRILIKLRSREGASLTFALLAFLVCAVISAILLASASAAAGRVSGLADMDQRYYAVTSAAQLFCDELESDALAAACQFELLRTTTETESMSSTKKEEGNWETISNYTPPNTTYSLYDSSTGTTIEAIPASSSFLVEAAHYFFFGDSLYNSSYSLDDLIRTSFDNSTRSGMVWDMTVSVAGSTTLTVYVKAFMDPQGNITMFFSNNTFSETATTKNDYFVKVELALDRAKTRTETNTPEQFEGSNNPDVSSVYSYSPAEGEITSQSYTHTTITNTIRTKSVGWTVSSFSRLDKTQAKNEISKLATVESGT